MSWVAVAIGGSALLGYAASGNAADKQAAGAGQASQLQTNMFNNTTQNLQPWQGTGKMALSQLGIGLGLPGAGAENDPRYNSILASNKASADEAHQQKYGMSIYDQRSGLSAPGEKARWEQQMQDTARQSYLQQYPGADQQQAGFGQLTKPFSLADFQASPAYNFNLEQGQMAIDKAAAARHNFYAPATLQQISKYSQGLASNEFQNAYSNYNTNMKNVWDRLYALSGSGQNAAAQQGGFGTTVGGQLGENTIGAANASAAGQIGGANAISGGVGAYYNQNMLSQYLAAQQAPTYPSGSKPSGQVAPDWMNA